MTAVSQLMWDDGERAFCRGWRPGDDGNRRAVLVVVPVAEHPSTASLERLIHEFKLKDVLGSAWALRPLDLEHEGGRTMLVLEDATGEPLERLLSEPMEMESFLRIAIAIAGALGKVHQRGLVHKDIKPTNIVVNGATGEVKLTGFGIASPLPRERQWPGPPETIAGTLAYMAPEQTGRMNRSIDSRSDLYALGITFYRMLTSALPFTATEPMEWVHCHLARRPVTPAERSREIPGAVSAIVIKLLAKWAEDRYQTAAGLEDDLRRCQAEWTAHRRIDDFQLGERDTPDRLLIPEKLYGRQREVETLLASFDRVVKGSPLELVLVSGYSGIGKSSVVNELQPVLVPPRGLFASGKFDQYKRDIPYSTLAQAFQSLIRPLLGKSEVELAPWREALRDALGLNAGLIVDLVPEVKLIIGEPRPVPEVPPQDAQRRFQMVVRQFISVFARPEHPLALFLDDLQWLDAATLDLLENLLTRSELQHFMLIGAYRDNEVTAAHPLARKLDAIKTAGGKVTEIALQPLTREHLGQLIADALHCESERGAPLAQLVQEKTAGNPLFAIQFISSLSDERMLAFDHHAECWSWDLDRIHAKGYTDNVADLMVGKLNRLPVGTQKALQHLACLGNVAETAALSIALESSDEQVHASLGLAVRLDLVERLEGSYKFVHDRVREAVYSLIPEELRAPAHLRIGRLLAAQMAPGKREEAIFEIVNQLNRGAALITTQEGRDEVAEVNLIAGKRAKASTAYASALEYIIAGAALLDGDCWERRRDLTFALDLERAECEFLTGALAAAEERLSVLSSRAGRLVDSAAVTQLRGDLFMTVGRSDRAVEACLDYLRRIGVQWSAHPGKEEVQREYERIWSQIGSRSIEDLVHLPLMTDPEGRATMDVLTATLAPAVLTDENLLFLVVCRMVNLSLEQGNSDGSCFAYVWLGAVIGSRFGNYRAGFSFGKLGLDLIEHHGLQRFEARVCQLFAIISYSTQPMRTGLGLMRRALNAANRLGDITFGGFSQVGLITCLLATGEPLADVQREAEAGLDFARRFRFGVAFDLISPLLWLLRTLRGLTREFGFFDDAEFDEGLFEQQLANDPRYSRLANLYWLRKLQARFFAGSYVSAVAAAANAHRLWPAISPGVLEQADYEFYAALARAALCQAGADAERAGHKEALATHHRQLQEWAENCPENFEHCAELVGAEIARIDGRDADAMSLYEKAIASARTNGFAHNVALAYEHASTFYRARGFNQFADLYLRNARGCYASWGADGKVRQLDQLYPHLRLEQQTRGPTSTVAALEEGLDLATVIRVSQAVSGGIVLEKLIDTVMHKAMEHAGAERGLLIVPRGDDLRIEGEFKVENDVIVRLRDTSAAAPALPESIVRYVMRTRENVVLDDASSPNPFFGDPYISQYRIRSLLCLPLINQANLNGILYLENNLTPHVFTADRVTILKVLASQAAISLENARLYHELADREARIRRLVDANIVGIFIADVEGRIYEANDAFLGIVGYDREDLASGRLRRTALIPPEWLERDERALAELRSAGSIRPFEKEYLRKDGSRVPVLVGVALFKDGGDEGLAFVLDLTERKRAEEAMRQLESDFAHMNRVSMMGELAASLSHEVAQPIATSRNNARAALNFLERQNPDLGEVREALECLVTDADRAGKIIDRIRDHMKKAPPKKDHFDLNAAINEMIALTRSAIVRNGVSVQTRFAGDLFPIQGDRVQLQQVVLNLILNAVEAMGSIEVGARELLISTEQSRTNGVLVTVRDSGPGIESAHLERVFQPFYTTKSNGTGMGLSICRSIIDAHGGRLWAEANHPRGAAFQFTLSSVRKEHSPKAPADPGIHEA